MRHAADTWVELLALGHKAWEVLAQRLLAGTDPPGEFELSQLQSLEGVLGNLCILQDHLYMGSTGSSSPKLAQRCEVAQLMGAAAAAGALRMACELASRMPSSEGGWPATALEVGQLGLITTCSSRLSTHLRTLAATGPSFSSKVAQRPDGSIAIAAALDAVRLGESVLRLVLGSGRQPLLTVKATYPDCPVLPRMLCGHALLIAAKWAKGDISPAARAQQQDAGTPGLYLLGLTRDGSGLQALLSLLATVVSGH